MITTREVVNRFLLILVASLLPIISVGLYLQNPLNIAPVLLLASVVLLAALFFLVRAPIWALFLTILIVMLPVYEKIAPLHSMVNRGLSIVSFLVWLVFVVASRTKIRLTSCTIFMFLFVLWSMITLFWTDNLSAGFIVLQTYILRLLVFLILLINLVRSKMDLDKIMLALALSGVVMVVAGLITLLVEGYSPGSRLKILDVNENSIGISLLMAAPGIFYWVSYSSPNKRKLKKWVAVIYMILTIGFIGLSGSRGSAISLAVFLLACLIWKPTRLYGFAGVVAIGIGLLFLPVIYNTTLERFLGSSGESLLSGRETLWPSGMLLIKENLWRGVGIGNSVYNVQRYLSILGGSFWVNETISLHNPPMVIWAETGIPGFILYLGVMLSAVSIFIRELVRSIRERSYELTPYFSFISSGFLAYMASWLKGGGMQVDFSYFLLLGLLILPSQLDTNTFVQDSIYKKCLSE